jgi:hypothetical protein
MAVEYVVLAEQRRLTHILLGQNKFRIAQWKILA